MCIIVCVCKQKTAYEMRISDWSSDVCSSDLLIDPANDVPSTVKNRINGIVEVLLNPIIVERRFRLQMTIIERHIIVPVVIEGTLGAHYNAICVPSIFFIARTQVHIVAIEVEIGGVRRKQGRSEERSVGKEGGSTCRSRGSRSP